VEIRRDDIRCYSAFERFIIPTHLGACLRQGICSLVDNDRTNQRASTSHVDAVYLKLQCSIGSKRNRLTVSAFEHQEVSLSKTLRGSMMLGVDK